MSWSFAGFPFKEWPGRVREKQNKRQEKGRDHEHLSGSLHNITQEELEMSTPDSKAEENLPKSSSIK